MIVQIWERCESEDSRARRGPYTLYTKGRGCVHFLTLGSFSRPKLAGLCLERQHGMLKREGRSGGVCSRELRMSITQAHPAHHLKRHQLGEAPDRKSTRLNSSHVKISYAVFCLKKKT